MNKIALVPNIHGVNFKAVVNDLQALHFEIYCPKGWGMGPENPSESEFVEEISVIDWLTKPSGFLFAFTADQFNFFRRMTHGDKIVFIPATKFENLLENFDDNPMLSHEPTHYRNYTGRKMWYFYRPTIVFHGKDIRKSFDDKKLFQMYNKFRERDLQGPAAADAFQNILPLKYYGADQPDGWLNLFDKSRVMSEAMFQVYFKSAGWCGCTVLESMQLGTPVASLSYMLYDSNYLLNKSNSLICDTVDELADRIKSMTFEEYEAMSKQCQIDIEEKMNDIKRRDNLFHLLFP